VDLSLGPDEEQIIDSARQFLARMLPVNRLHGHADSALSPPDVRLQAVEMGWLAIALPEELGGLGLGPIEEMLVFREIGRGLGPTAILPTMLAVHAAALAQSPLAEELAAGEAGCALAVPARGAAEGDLSGVRLYDHEGANCALISRKDETLLIDIASLPLTSRPCLDKSVSMADVDLSGAPILAKVPGRQIRRRGLLALAAMQLGTAEAVTSMIVDYAKVRTTFGKPIGAYQAVRHACADMEVRCMSARAQAIYAAIALRDDLVDADLMLDAAFALALEAAVRNTDDNIQLHGGIGITMEHDAHLYMKRAQVLCHWFGSESSALDRIAQASLATAACEAEHV
jgi:alkylation response protein AidB-like acyl-CoA dehydrogenase